MKTQVAYATASKALRYHRRYPEFDPYQAKATVFLLKRLWGVVVAQLIARSLPKPEDQGSNPVIATFIEHIYC